MNVIFDLDGTLADIRHRLHFIDNDRKVKQWKSFFDECDRDEPIMPVIKTLESMYKTPQNPDYAATSFSKLHDIEIWSGRNAGKNDYVARMTLEWLRRYMPRVVFDYARSMRPFFVNGYNRKCGEVILRMRQPHDYRPDHELKREWLKQARAQGEWPNLVFEDRDRVVEMWRKEGIICCQVAPGDF